MTFPTEDMPLTHILVVSDVDRSRRWYTDVRAAHETLRDRGADFLTPPVDHGAETRCFFGDPDGHLFEISEYRSPG